MSKQMTTADFDLIYRPQGLRFGDIMGTLPYLKDLGVSGVYFGPVLEAASDGWPTNNHGYDAVKEGISPWRGGAQGLERLLDAMGELGMAPIIDWVPHHVEREHVFVRGHPHLMDEYTLPDGSRHARRFFDYDHLRGLSQDPANLRKAHTTFLDMVHRRKPFVRIDHPDGMDDPAFTVELLTEAGCPGAWYEKVVTDGEPLPHHEKVLGEVGHYPNFLQTALMHSAAGVAELTAFWREQVGERRSFTEVDRSYRTHQARSNFQAPIRRALAELGAGTPPLTVEDVAAIMATCPRYRTYLLPERAVDDNDMAVLDAMEMPHWLREGLKRGEYGGFARHLQPVSAACFAKGREDGTLFYYTPIPGLNEVGFSQRL